MTEPLSSLSQYQSRQFVTGSKFYNNESYSSLESRVKVRSEQCKELRKEIQELEWSAKIKEKEHQEKTDYYIQILASKKTQSSHSVAVQTGYGHYNKDALKSENERLKRVNRMYKAKYDLLKKEEEYKQKCEAAIEEREKNDKIINRLTARNKELRAKIREVTAQTESVYNTLIKEITSIWQAQCTLAKKGNSPRCTRSPANEMKY